ncbi:MAG: GGDEF domain-containing protein, partial [Lachnospiraceae bacterium]|nr:GGDEF domain-containing protein [Lachnospiraceae bacterium]
ISDFKSVFTKDTTSEGESAKLLIVLRILFASIIVYSVIGCIYSACSGYFDAVLCFAGALIIYAMMFFSSYYIRIATLIIATNIVSVLGIVGGYFFLGPLVSVQNFFIVVVVTCYFSGYGNYKKKGLFTLFVFVLYFILQTRFGKIAGIIPFSFAGQRFLQFLNVFASFWCVALVCYVYSRDSQHLEGKLIEYNKMLRQQASTDTLTGLHNRRSANDFIEKLIKKNDEKGFCVCMCDIDFFKKVNDSYGHDIGDKVLAGVAQTLVENVTEDCLVSRWGGEEFLIVFPNMNGDEARSALDMIRSRVKKIEFDTGSTTFSITITYGLAEYGFDGDADAVVKEADDKLYIGKENGRDQIVF